LIASGFGSFAGCRWVSGDSGRSFLRCRTRGAFSTGSCRWRGGGRRSLNRSPRSSAASVRSGSRYVRRPGSRCISTPRHRALLARTWRSLCGCLRAGSARRCRGRLTLAFNQRGTRANHRRLQVGYFDAFAFRASSGIGGTGPQLGRCWLLSAFGSRAFSNGPGRFNMLSRSISYHSRLSRCLGCR